MRTGARAAPLGLLGLLAACPAVLDLDAYEDASSALDAAPLTPPPDGALVDAGWVGQLPPAVLPEAGWLVPFPDPSEASTLAPPPPDVLPEPPEAGPCQPALPPEAGTSAGEDTAASTAAVGRGWQLTIPDAATPHDGGEAPDAPCETANRARPE